MNYTFKTYIPIYYHDYYTCNLWSVNQIYNFASRGHFKVMLSIDRLGCEDINLKYSYLNLFVNKLIWIHFIIIGLAIYSIVKTWILLKIAFDSYLKFKTEKVKVMEKIENDKILTKTENDKVK